MKVERPASAMADEKRGVCTRKTQYHAKISIGSVHSTGEGEMRLGSGEQRDARSCERRGTVLERITRSRQRAGIDELEV